MSMWLSASRILQTAVLMCSVLLSACNATAQHSFEWRSIYSPTNTDGAIREAYGTSHVDYDWDLWGHNLKKIVGAHPHRDMLATIADTVCDRQYCFSSSRLYDTIQEYILDQYGEGTPQYSARICIMPQDNKLACQCAKCRKAGNTDGNATPAVTKMLRRLAARFPRHQFFTSSYHSTRVAPDEPLPENVGVLLSAIDLPMRVDFSATEGYRRFMMTARQWKSKAKRIYVWDYERNYEDYLSPFPCLYVMQARLRLYRELGLQGVFMNGSGDEYSSFDDMQTVVLAKLMKDPDLDIDSAVHAYYDEFYPQTASLIADYYLGLEHRVKETNHLLPLYATTEELVESYLVPEEFRRWRADLDRASKSVRKPERTRLNYLLTALSFTQLQLLSLDKSRLQEPDSPESILRDEMLEVLRGHKELKGMTYYSETYNKIDDYISGKK